jgi:hypothetical protein
MSVDQDSLETLFQTIGEQNLVTEQARALAVPKEGEPAALNHRPLAIQGGVMEYGFLERLHDHGVDIVSPTNSTLLGLIDEVNANTGFDKLPRPQIEDIPAAVAELRRLRDGIAAAEAAQADVHIVDQARQMLSNGDLSVLESAQPTKVEIAETDLQTLREIAIAFSENDVRNQRDSLRETAVIQLYLLAQHPPAAKAAIKRVEELASDADPRIRQAVLRNLITLFSQVPAKVWKLAESFAKDEDTIPSSMGNDAPAWGMSIVASPKSISPEEAFNRAQGFGQIKKYARHIHRWTALGWREGSARSVDYAVWLDYPFEQDATMDALVRQIFAAAD